MRGKMKTGLPGAAALWLAPMAGAVQEARPFVPGTIIIRAGDEASRGGTTSTVGAGEVVRQNRTTLDEALGTVPGVHVGDTGGSRNGRLVHVRGFDRFQALLSVDGFQVAGQLSARRQ